MFVYMRNEVMRLKRNMDGKGRKNTFVTAIRISEGIKMLIDLEGSVFDSL